MINGDPIDVLQVISGPNRARSAADSFNAVPSALPLAEAPPATLSSRAAADAHDQALLASMDERESKPAVKTSSETHWKTLYQGIAPSAKAKQCDFTTAEDTDEDSSEPIAASLLDQPQRGLFGTA